MKTYIVSEELLRQVLDELTWIETHTEYGSSSNADALRTILAKEPSEPHSWVQKTKEEMAKDNRSFMQPLYTKDA